MDYGCTVLYCTVLYKPDEAAEDDDEDDEDEERARRHADDDGQLLLGQHGVGPRVGEGEVL